MSQSALPASEAAMMFSGEISAVTSENEASPRPSETISFPNLEILFSPANQPATPPSLGIAEVMSQSALPASEAAMMFSGEISAVTSENEASPRPSETISFPNLEILFSPANQLATPPSLGIHAVISASALAASAAFLTFSPSIPATLSENSTRHGPKAAMSFPKSAIDIPPPRNEAMP